MTVFLLYSGFPHTFYHLPPLQTTENHELLLRIRFRVVLKRWRIVWVIPVHQARCTHKQPKETIMWTKPAATEMRFGFEVTMYVMNK